MNIFRHHKGKIGLMILFYIIAVYLLFPFSDLSDLVASKVFELTQGQVFIDFDKLDLSFIPPGLELGQVSVETPYTGTLAAKYIDVSPNIMGLLVNKPGGTIHAKELLGGDVDVAVKTGSKIAGPPVRAQQKISIELSDVNLGAVSKVAELPLQAEGKISGTVDATVDPMMNEQPSADVDLKADRAVIPEGSVQTPMGPLGLPRLNIGSIEAQGKLEKGFIEIGKLIIGKAGSDINANVTGRMESRVTNGNFFPGAYDLSIHLTVSENFKNRMGPYLAILSAYSSGPNSFAFRVQGQGPQAAPNITKIP